MRFKSNHTNNTFQRSLIIWREKPCDKMEKLYSNSPITLIKITKFNCHYKIY